MKNSHLVGLKLKVKVTTLNYYFFQFKVIYEVIFVTIGCVHILGIRCSKHVLILAFISGYFLSHSHFLYSCTTLIRLVNDDL